MRQHVEALFQRNLEELVGCAEFRALEDGRATPQDYDRFLCAVFETHQTSPHFFGFLFGLAPPGSAARLRENLLEELGLAADGEESHPDLLVRLLEGAGLADRIDELRRQAQQRLAEYVMEPLLYGCLRDVGLAALVRIVAFEHMLSRTSGRIARFLQIHRGIEREQLVWFSHHAEIDLQHAEEGLESIVDFAGHYGFDPTEAQDIARAALRENLFIKCYFGVEAAARARRVLAERS